MRDEGLARRPLVHYVPSFKREMCIRDSFPGTSKFCPQLLNHNWIQNTYVYLLLVQYEQNISCKSLGGICFQKLLNHLCGGQVTHSFFCPLILSFIGCIKNLFFHCQASNIVYYSKPVFGFLLLSFFELFVSHFSQKKKKTGLIEVKHLHTSDSPCHSLQSQLLH